MTNDEIQALLNFPIRYTDAGDPVVALADVIKVLGISEQEALQRLKEIGGDGAVIDLRPDQIHRPQ